MKKDNDIIVDIWKSYPNYLAKKSVALSAPNIGDYMANLFCPGPYFYYIIDSPTLTVEHASPSMSAMLDLDEPSEFLNSLMHIIHPDDHHFFFRCEDMVGHFLQNCIPPEKIVNYKHSYCLRERTRSGEYKLFLLQTITLKATEDGALLKVFGAHTDISHITPVNNRKLSFIGLNGEPSYLNIDVFDDTALDNFTPYPYQGNKETFSKRELEIVRLLAKGLSTKTISEELFISSKTVITHRRNILKKAGVKNTAELIAKCIREGYI